MTVLGIPWFVQVIGYGLCFRFFMCRLWPRLHHRPPKPFLAWDTLGYMLTYTLVMGGIVALGTLAGLLK